MSNIEIWVNSAQQRYVEDYGIMAQTPQDARLKCLGHPPSTIVVVVSFLPQHWEGQKMATKREKTLSYRRALWLNENPSSISLGACVKQAIDKLKSIDDRTITRGNGQFMKLLKADIDKVGGVFLHISIETPGESASVVPSIHDVDTVDVSTTKPPPDTEFMDGDAFLYVFDDDVCLCSTIMRDGAITVFLQELFRKAVLRKDAGRTASPLRDNRRGKNLKYFSIHLR